MFSKHFQLLFLIILVHNLSHELACGRNTSVEFDSWKYYVTQFTSIKNNCSSDLMKLVDLYDANNSHYTSRQFFESWIKTTSMDLWTLEIFEIMSNHMKCELDRANTTTKLWDKNRYCTYELPEQKLAHGLLLGYCVPHSCNDKHALSLGRLMASKGGQNNSRKVKKEELICANGHKESPGWKFYATLVFTLVAVVLSVVGTLLDCPRHEAIEDPLVPKVKHRSGTLARIFSLQSNFKKLIHHNAETSIDSLHFMKVAAMVMIMLCHMFFLTQIFAENIEVYRSYKISFFYQIFFNGSYLAGTFFTIGGALHTYITLTKYAKAENNDEHSVKPKFTIVALLCTVINRYLRIIPLYLYCILLITYVLPYYNQYPLWHPWDPSVQCPKDIWRHLLFINNFKQIQLCMPWTWYLAVDFQLFLFFCPVGALFIYRPRSAVILCIACIVATCTARVVLVLYNDFPPALTLLLPFPQYNMNFASYSFEIYMKPYTWAPSYSVGLLIGYVVYYVRSRKRFTMSMPVQIGLWSFTVIGLFWTPYGVYFNANGFKNNFYDGCYVALNPVVWSLALGWIAVYSQCFTNVPYVVKAFFRIKFWLVLSNLTFGCYLVHLVFGFWLLYRYALDQGGQPKIQLYARDLYGVFICTLLISYIVSFFMYMIIEGPASNIQSFLLRKFFDSLRRRASLKRAREERRYLIQQLQHLDNVEITTSSANSTMKR